MNIAFWRLPSCDPLFLKFFDPWYEERDRKRKVFKGTRPDAQAYTRPGIRAKDASPLAQESQERVAKDISVMIDAVKEDFPTYLDVHGEPSIDWINAFDAYYDEQRIKSIIKKSDPKDFGNLYFVTCCEFGALLGHVFTQYRDCLEWLTDWPYWESGILDTTTGVRIHVFHWAVKKMSSYGVDDGFRAKFLATIKLIDHGWKPDE
jgi:hypothetical protein